MLIVLVSISPFANAQEKGTQELVGGIGFFSSNDFLNSAETIISGVSYENTTTSPTINFTYKNTLKDNWFLYADGSLQFINADVLEDGVKTGDVSHRYWTAGLGTEYHYIHNDWFQMYSGASIAYSLLYSDFSSPPREDKNDGYFNFQISAVGFRVGRALAAVVELGVGYKGIANAGISYQF